MEIITPYDKIPRPESLRDCGVLHFINMDIKKLTSDYTGSAYPLKSYHMYVLFSESQWFLRYILNFR
jgi:hypothetical protein